MTDLEIFEKMRSAVELITRRPAASLRRETRFISDLGLESIDIVDVLFELEKLLGVTINLAEVFQSERKLSGQKEQFDLSIQDIINYVLKSTQ